MDCTASRRFTATNVSWPSSRFFIPNSGLTDFLLNNIWLKVCLLIPQIFTDAYVADTVWFLTTPQREELCCRVRELVHHVMYAAKIRQNELRVSYTIPAIPSEAAWMFHVLQVILVVVGFDTETNCPSKVDRSPVSAESEGTAAQSQATFFLDGALSTFCERMKASEAVFDYPEYDPSHWVSNNFAYRSRPTSFLPIPVDDSLADSFEYNEAIAQWRECGMEAPATGVSDAAAKAAGLAATVNIVHCLLKQGPTHHSVRVLASQISGEGMPGAIDIDFFVKEEERARSELSHSLLPELVTLPPSSEE
ncbi:hypothetical protein DFH08DRAFT_978748 [Mycena albidolilacea]|uniref:Uncharacterized protein n=1 Tax=Mycena albidolilacea TaxID=1033008 RepID=A0AAD7E774_9AGAR|nr:hypothetical protein DFH08DRAFT_978748 [Mycena albidolilacea]